MARGMLLTVVGDGTDDELLDGALVVLGHHHRGRVELLGTLADNRANLCDEVR